MEQKGEVLACRYHGFLWIIIVTPMVALFIDRAVRKRAANMRRFLTAWGYFFRISWGVALWFIFVAMISGLLHRHLAPDQNAYIFSGSPITLWTSLILAAIIGWIVIGPERDDEAAGPYSSFDKRLDNLGLMAWTVIKGGLWLAAGLFAIVLLYWFGTAVQVRMETMPTSEAVIIGAVIVALALYYGLRARN